jgi:hypothetical protein
VPGSGRSQHPIARPIANSATTNEANIGHRRGREGATCGQGDGEGPGPGGAGGVVDILLNATADPEFR